MENLEYTVDKKKNPHFSVTQTWEENKSFLLKFLYLRRALWGSRLLPRDADLPGCRPPLSLFPQLLLQIKPGGETSVQPCSQPLTTAHPRIPALLRRYLCFLRRSASACRLSILSPKSCLKSRLASNARSRSLSACLHLVWGGGGVNIYEW